MTNLVTRAWNGTPIARRTTDGFVNATAMCKANGKEWSKYRESDRCQTYLDALAETSEIRMFDLIESRQGQGGGTWVHPQLAVDLARWISAPFAVWMDGWFLEEVERVSQVQDTQTPALPAPADQVKAAAEGLVFIWDALETRGLADDRDRIELKRDLKVLHTALVQTTTGQLPGTSNVLSPVDKLPRFLGRAVDVDAPLTLVEWSAAYLPQEINSVVSKYDSALGKELARIYRERHNDEPQTTVHLSIKAEEGRRKLNLPMFGMARNGNAVTPKIYLPRDWDLMVLAMRHKMVITPDKAAELLAECQQFREGLGQLSEGQNPKIFL